MIPANDDSTKSIEVILGVLCDAIQEGIDERKTEKVDMDAAGESADEDASTEATEEEAPEAE